jgi:hypothetical protein
MSIKKIIIQEEKDTGSFGEDKHHVPTEAFKKLGQHLIINVIT